MMRVSGGTVVVGRRSRSMMRVSGGAVVDVVAVVVDVVV